MTDFNPTKPVQTRDGRKARVVCTDRRDDKYPLLGLVDSSPGDGPSRELISYWSRHGSCSGDNCPDGGDLVNVPEEMWINIYRGDDTTFGGAVHSSKYIAEAMTDPDCGTRRLIARISFTKGEGLEK